jgi:hypothetical protein
MPVATVNQAATQRGHFGKSTNIAPGTIEATAFESRRAARLGIDFLTQHSSFFLLTRQT